MDIEPAKDSNKDLGIIVPILYYPFPTDDITALDLIQFKIE